MKDILDKVNSIKDWVIDIRRDLHTTPEIGMKEFVTNSKIRKYLDEINIDYKLSPYNTSIVASIFIDKDLPTIALRADMDALPILEQNEVSYKSQNPGNMHACGHDAHTAILLGTCKVLYDMKDLLICNIKFFFQPAEETVGGAKFMIEEGCMDNPKVDYVLGLHVSPLVDMGCIEVKYDSMNASTDTLSISIKGKDGHGAYPHLGVDAILCTSHVITALQSIVSRNINPVDSVVISIGHISGGTQGNIICDEVKLIGTLRTLNSDTRIYAKKRINEIISNTCKSFDCDYDIDIEEGYPSLVNDSFVVDIIKENGKILLGDNNVKIKEHSSLGAEDFSFFLEHSKGAFFNLGCRNEDKNIIYPLHTSKFDIDENCLTVGILLHIMNVISLSSI